MTRTDRIRTENRKWRWWAKDVRNGAAMKWGRIRRRRFVDVVVKHGDKVKSKSR